MTLSCILLATLLAALIGINTSISSDFFTLSGGHSVRQPGDNSDDGSYYKVLGHGINRESNVDEIKKAYRKKAMLLHPDKGGNTEDFKTLTEAYEILSDTQKKSIYDKFGVAGLNGANRGSRSSASDMAREFFKGFGAFSVPLVFQLDLSLEDFYLGKEITIPIDSSQQVKVVIEPGMFGGQELVAQAEYRGMAREIILRLREIRHSVFLRKNADLLIDINISLAEALLGFKRTIRLLDGKEVTILSPAGEISGPDTVYIIANLGMPVYRTQQEVRGRLFVRSKLEMPKKMRISDPHEINELRRLLSNVDGSSESISSKYPGVGVSEQEPGLKGDNHYSEDEGSVELIPADIRSFGQFGSGPDDDDDDFQRNPFAQYFFR